MIIDDNGKTFIINRKFNVNSSTEPCGGSLLSPGEVSEDWIKKDKYFRQEIAKEAEEYKKKNPFPQTEEKLPDTSNQKK